MVLVGGEISTGAQMDIEAWVRQCLRKIGYFYPELSLEAESCAVLCAVGKQSPDIRAGVDMPNPDAQGAGDQGTIFVYATE